MSDSTGTGTGAAIDRAPAAATRVRWRAATVLLTLAALFVLRIARPVLVPVLVSVLVAYALEPAVVLLIRCRVPRVAAAACVYVMLALAAGSLARTVAGQVTSFLDDLPREIASLRHQADAGTRAVKAPLTQLQRAASDLQPRAAQAAPGAARVRRITIVDRRFDLRDYLLHAGVGAVSNAVDLFAVALLSFLLLATGDLYKRKLVKLAGPTLSDKKVTVDILHSIDLQIERYLLVRLLISAIVAAATAGGLLLVGLPHALVWGVIAGALNVVPFIGSTAAIALIALAAFVQFHALTTVAAAAGVALLVAVLEGNVLTPWLTSRAGDLNTVAMFVGVLFWGWMWDVWGLLLAVPIMVAVKAAADRIEPLQPLGELLGE